MFRDKKRQLSGVLKYKNHKSVPYDIVVIDSVLYKDSLEKMVKGLEKSFLAMSEKFGPYPYQKLTIMIGEKCVNCFLSDGMIMEKAPEEAEVLSKYIANLLSAIWVRGNFDVNSYKHTWIQRGLMSYYYEKYATENEEKNIKDVFGFSFVEDIYRNQRIRTLPSLSSIQGENVPQIDWIRRMNKSGVR